MTITFHTARLQDVYPVDRPTAPSAATATTAGVDGSSPQAEVGDGAGRWADGSVAEAYREAQRIATMRDMALRQAAGSGASAPPPVPIAVAPAAAIAPLTMPTAAEIAAAEEAARERAPHRAAATGSGEHVVEVATRFAEARAAAARTQALARPEHQTPATEPQPARTPAVPAVPAERADAAPHAGGAPLGYLLGAHD